MQVQTDNRLELAMRGKEVIIPASEFSRIAVARRDGDGWRGEVFPKWDSMCGYVTPKVPDSSQAFALIEERKFRRWDHPYPTDY